MLPQPAECGDWGEYSCATWCRYREQQRRQHFGRCEPRPKRWLNWLDAASLNTQASVPGVRPGGRRSGRQPPNCPRGDPRLGLRDRWYLLGVADLVGAQPVPTRLLGEGSGGVARRRRRGATHGRPLPASGALGCRSAMSSAGSCSARITTGDSTATANARRCPRRAAPARWPSAPASA